MGVNVKANPGYDLGYVWKNQGAQPQRERSAAGYYINAAQDGEPPGRWWGPGAEALGFQTGQVVEREPYELVYRQIDPRTGEKMGRSAGSYDQWADWLVKLKAAEPHATAERVMELQREAAQKTRQAPVYTDMTVSFQVDQRVPCLHQGERAPGAAGGGGRGNGVLAGRGAAYQAVVQAANRAGLEYVQRWAGMTRTG